MMILLISLLLLGAVLPIDAVAAGLINEHQNKPVTVVVQPDTMAKLELIKPIAPKLLNPLPITVGIPADLFFKSKIKSPRRGLFWRTIKKGEFWLIFGYLSLTAIVGGALVGLIGLGIAALFKAATSSVFWICFGVAGSLFVLIAFGIAFLAINIA